jgi:hypothetical protein
MRIHKHDLLIFSEFRENDGKKGALEKYNSNFVIFQGFKIMMGWTTKGSEFESR